MIPTFAVESALKEVLRYRELSVTKELANVAVEKVEIESCTVTDPPTVKIPVEKFPDKEDTSCPIKMFPFTRKVSAILTLVVVLMLLDTISLPPVSKLTLGVLL